MAGLKKGPARRKFSAKMDIQELNAFATAYGNPLGTREYVMFVGGPAAILTVVVTLLYFNFIASIIAFIVGAIYGFKNYLPHQVKRNYLIAGLNARGRYMTVTTQLATNDTKSMMMVLRESVDRIDPGTELHHEMTELVANIGTNIQTSNVRRQFAGLRSKYRHDSIFTQYLEQLETGVLNGNNNIDTLQEIERYHTDLRARTHEFIKEKDGSKKNYAFIGMWVIGLQAGCAFLLGLKAFQAGFSQSPVGLIFGLPFLLIETWVFVSFFRDYWDDDIMSVKKSK